MDSTPARTPSSPSTGRTRRDLLAAGTAAGLTAAGVLWWDGLLVGGGPRVEPTPPGTAARALDPALQATLAAVQDRLLPTTPDSPGAASTNTIGYLDAAMASPDVPQDTKDLVRQGAAHVDRSARWYRKNRFHELTALQQDAILRGLERDIRMGLRWLRAMLVLTLEGFLCDPVHGGNRDEAAWRWLGHVPGQPRPTTPYLRMDDLAR